MSSSLIWPVAFYRHIGVFCLVVYCTACARATPNSRKHYRFAWLWELTTLTVAITSEALFIKTLHWPIGCLIAHTKTLPLPGKYIIISPRLNLAVLNDLYLFPSLHKPFLGKIGKIVVSFSNVSDACYSSFSFYFHFYLL